MYFVLPWCDRHAVTAIATVVVAGMTVTTGAVDGAEVPVEATIGRLPVVALAGDGTEVETADPPHTAEPTVLQ